MIRTRIPTRNRLTARHRNAAQPPARSKRPRSSGPSPPEGQWTGRTCRAWRGGRWPLVRRWLDIRFCGSFLCFLFDDGLNALPADSIPPGDLSLWDSLVAQSNDGGSLLCPRLQFGGVLFGHYPDSGVGYGAIRA